MRRPSLPRDARQKTTMRKPKAKRMITSKTRMRLLVRAMKRVTMAPASQRKSRQPARLNRPSLLQAMTNQVPKRECIP